MTYLIDTDYVADYLKGYHAATTTLKRLFPEGMGISIITFAEVYEVIYYGHNSRQHERGFRSFLQTTPVLGITYSVAKQFARIHGDLRAKGRLIPEPDLFIAATAIHHHLTLITRNIKDYQHIPQLNLYKAA